MLLRKTELKGVCRGLLRLNGARSTEIFSAWLYNGSALIAIQGGSRGASSHQAETAMVGMPVLDTGLL